MRRIVEKNGTFIIGLAGVAVLGGMFYGFKTLFTLPQQILSPNPSQKLTEEALIASLKNDKNVSKALVPAMYERADRLDKAMVGLGTDENAIREVFNELKDSTGVKALYVAHHEKYFNILWGMFHANLVQRLRNEMSEADFATISGKLKLGGFI